VISFISRQFARGTPRVTFIKGAHIAIRDDT